MADIYFSNYLAVEPVTHIHQKQVVTKTSFTAALALADVLNLLRIPKKACVLTNLRIVVPDLESETGSPLLLVNVGYTGDTDAFAADESTICRAGGMYNFTTLADGSLAEFEKNDADRFICIEIDTAAETSPTSGTIYAIADFNFTPQGFTPSES